MYFNPDSPGSIVACPDCGNDNVQIVQPYSYEWKRTFGNPAIEKAYESTYLDADKREPQFMCNPCFDEWHETEYNEENDEYWSYPKGLAPLHRMRKVDIFPLQNPGIEKVCHYPSKCYCGQCPNPDQLQFNLRGASKEWWEDEDDGSTMGGRSGRCFELSGKRSLYHPDKGLTLVHGTIQNFGKPAIAHGWVEHSDGTMHDPTTDQTFDSMVFNAFFNPVIEKRYSKEEVYDKIFDSGHFGPWHETKGLI